MESLILTELRAQANPQLATSAAKFHNFEDDRIVLGVNSTEIKTIIRGKKISFEEIQFLLQQREHEARICACMILISVNEKLPEKVTDFYLKNQKLFNNWDLVDMTAPQILGGYIQDRKRDVLDRLAISPNKWYRRVSMVCTLHFVQQQDYVDALRIAQILLKDEDENVLKAVGNVLNEIGKKERRILLEFLGKNFESMPKKMQVAAIRSLPKIVRETISRETKILNKKK